MNERLLTTKELAELNYSYYGHFKISRDVDLWVKEVISRAQDTKTAATKDREWKEKMQEAIEAWQTIMTAKDAECQAMIEGVFDELEAEVFSVCHEAKTLSLPGMNIYDGYDWWQDLKARYRKEGV